LVCAAFPSKYGLHFLQIRAESWVLSSLANVISLAKTPELEMNIFEMMTNRTAHFGVGVQMTDTSSEVLSGMIEDRFSGASVRKPEKRSWQRRKDKRHQEILEAAAGLFRENGESACTMWRVAEAAGITKGTIYLYFRNKEELLCWVMTGAAPVLPEAGLEAVDCTSP
jgi:hypothetical protein